MSAPPTFLGQTPSELDWENVAMIWEFIVTDQKRRYELQELCRRILAHPDTWHAVTATDVYLTGVLAGVFEDVVVTRIKQGSVRQRDITYTSLDALVRDLRFHDRSGRTSQVDSS